MTYNDLLAILLSSNVYELLKENEIDLFNLIPEMKVCKGFNQNNKWHIYDVYEHILRVVSGTNNILCLRLSALFHDIGKPLAYTVDEKGIGHFHHHWDYSLIIFNKYKDFFNLSKEEVELISKLILYHDARFEKLSLDNKYKIVNDLGKENIRYLFMLKRADLLAQSPEFHYFLDILSKQEEELNNL